MQDYCDPHQACSSKQAPPTATVLTMWRNKSFQPMLVQPEALSFHGRRGDSRSVILSPLSTLNFGKHPGKQTHSDLLTKLLI